MLSGHGVCATEVVAVLDDSPGSRRDSGVDKHHGKDGPYQGNAIAVLRKLQIRLEGPYKGGVGLLNTKRVILGGINP